MTQITRRNFLKVSAAGTATAILTGCGGERWVELVPYVVAPEEQLAGVLTYFARPAASARRGAASWSRL